MTEEEKARLAELKAKTELTAEEKTEVEGLEGKTEKPDEKKFTQKQVNDIVKKEKALGIEKLLKDLGVESFENAKDGLEKLKKMDDDKKTDLEKLQEQVKTLTDAQGEKESSLKSKDNKIALLSAGVPKDKLDKYSKLLNTCEGEDIEENIKSTLEDFPLVAPTPDAPDLGGKTGGSSEKTTEQVSADLDAIFGLE